MGKKTDMKKKSVKPSEKSSNKAQKSDAVAENEEQSTGQSLTESILKLGGSKKDFDLVDVDDGSDVELLEIGEDKDTEPIKKDDIAFFIEQLGIKKQRPDLGDKKEKKVKLVSSEYFDKEDEPTTSKKKSKNKFKVQDEEISSTTPTEPADSTSDPVAVTPTVVSDDVIQTQQGVANLSALIKYIEKGYKKRNHCLIKADRWLEQLENKSAPVHTGRPHKKITEVEQFAKRLLDDDTETFEEKKSGAEKSDLTWMKKMVSSGTLADRAAALTTLIQQDSIHNIYNLENMVNMVQKKDRRESMAAIDTLKDIFADLLPNKRKLRTFAQMPLEMIATQASGNKDTQDRLLALWYFESHLKSVYQAFVDAVIAATFDTVSAHKTSALKVLLALLVAKPEQEQRLLSGLVNKLGDPERKIAANVSHLLALLVKKHPNMKLIVATEVENILYRSNIAKKAQYYAICFLNQMILGDNDKELSVKLVTVYFSFFKASIKQNELDSKLMSALLVGVVRAFPFAKGDEKLNLEEQMGAIYKLVHTVNKFTVSLQALSLLYQVSTASDNISDRYYTSLYAKLLDPEIKNSSKQSNFLNLLYKSMKSDPSDKRCKAFVKRLLQICLSQSPTFICAALMTISELVKHKPGVISFKSTVLDGDDSSDEEEHFVDADSDSDDDSDPSDQKDNNKEKETSQTTTGKNTTGWTHKANDSEKYDGLARNPLYCTAERCLETELSTLASHYHPSVVVFAQHLLDSEPIVYIGDPMNDFSLQKFLDRFVFRNPKKVTKGDKMSGALSKKNQTSSKKKKSLPVNTEKFYNQESELVPADQRFFHSYFHTLNDASAHKLGSKLGLSDKTEKSFSDEDVDDADFDSYLSKNEGSLYADMKQAFDQNFARDFGSKKKEGNEGDDSDSSDDDDEGGDFDTLKASDFGLSDDDLNSDGMEDELIEELESEKTKKKTKSMKQLAADDDMSSGSDSEDLPLDMDDDMLDDMDSDDDGDIKSLFAPAPDQLGGAEIDEEDINFSDDEFGGLDFSGKGKSKKAPPATKVKKRKFAASAGNSTSIFAAADEFADLLDEESGDKRDTTSSHAVINRGKADQKQSAWEDRQERWLGDKNRKRSHKPSSSHKKAGARKPAGAAKKRRK